MTLEMFRRYLSEPAKLIEGGIVQPIWFPSGNKFCYLNESGKNKEYLYVDAVQNTIVPFLDLQRLNSRLTSIIHEPLPEGLLFDQFVFLDEQTIAFQIGNRKISLHIETYEAALLPEVDIASEEIEKHRTPAKFTGFFGNEASEILSPNQEHMLGVKDFNIYLRSCVDGRLFFITNDGTKEQPWVDFGLHWTPDSLHVLAKKFDCSGVSQVPVVHWLKIDEEVEYQYFPKSGQKSFGQDLFVIDILSRNAVRLQTGDSPKEYINLVGFSNKTRELLFACLDREFKQLDIRASDIRTGISRKLFSERQETFLNYEPFESPPIHFVSEGEKFIWLSERDGWNQLYLYDIQGNLIQKLTQGEFVVDRVITIDETSGFVYFSGFAEERLYDEHLYRVKLDGSLMQRVSDGPGSHFIQFSPTNQYFLDTYSTPAKPPVAVLRNKEGKYLRKISEMQIERLKTELGWIEPEEFIAKADDGMTDLYGYVYKPCDFDPTHQYPVLEYIYNGPHAAIVPRAFLPAMMKVSGISRVNGYSGDIHEALAQLGFIVIVTDGRGTSQRGKAFQDVIYRKVGIYEIPDHIAVLKQLAQNRPWMDLSRVGITGYSYGGYLTLLAMLTAPDFYKVGVAVAPIPDLFCSGWAYPEHYMDLPQNNPQGYQIASCLNKAAALKGKLLIVAGTSDTNAFFNGVIKMINAFVLAGKPYDLLLLPEQTHLYQGKSSIYWLERMADYFMKYL